MAILKSVAADTLPVLNMPLNVCDSLLREDKYRSYHQRVNSSERAPAKAQHDSDRTIVGSRLFPGFFQDIIYGCLSPTRQGLTSYGEIAVRWDVDDNYLAKRVSILEENSFLFFDRHKLGDRGKDVPVGYRCAWRDRHMLLIAKLEPDLKTNLTRADVNVLVLSNNDKRAEDSFFEVHIYAPGGLDTEDVNSVVLQSELHGELDLHRWEIISAMSLRLGIECEEEQIDSL